MSGCKHSYKSKRFWFKSQLHQLTSLVSMDRLINFFMPQLLYQKNSDNNTASQSC